MHAGAPGSVRRDAPCLDRGIRVGRSFNRHGTVIPGRAGEAWFLDEFGGFGEVSLFEAPTTLLARRFDTNPHRTRTSVGRAVTARLYWWCLRHPRCGRPALIVVVLQVLSMAAVSVAPRASASTNTVILNFTGLTDSYGVPIGDYSLAVAALHEQITHAGPRVSVDPATWMSWTAHTLEVMLSGVMAAAVLTAEAGFFVGMVALALWLMKITVSAYWVTVIGEIARAIASAVIQVTTGIGLLVLAVPIGVFVGAATIHRGEAGQGWTRILIALTLPTLSVAVFADPAGEMYGPDGLLAFGRRVGFSIAEAATHNGSLAGPAGGVDALTASLITRTVREPLQLWNFGHVVDRVGGCGAAWSAAVRTGVPDAPITAMASCGDRAAVTYAQHLDASNAWIGVIFVAAAALLALFMVVSGWAVLKVSVKAIWTTVILLPSLWLGAIPGAPQRRALDVMWQFFRHGIEVTVYIVYVSVIGLAIERIVVNPLPADLGGTSAFAHVLMLGAVSVVALLLLRHIRSDLAGPSRGRGLLGRASEVAVGMGLRAAIGGAGSAALAGAKGVRGRSSSGRLAALWEELDQIADDAGRVHGTPQPGVDPVANANPQPAPGTGPGASSGPAEAVVADPSGEAGARTSGGASRRSARGADSAGFSSREPLRDPGIPAENAEYGASHARRANEEAPAHVAPITDAGLAHDNDPLMWEPSPNNVAPLHHDDDGPPLNPEKP